MQYTVRSIPPDVDRAIKARARQLGKSVNQVVIEAMAQSLGLPVRRRNLRNMAGEWSREEARAFDNFLSSVRQVDEELWK
jgi:hypothetical protein